MNRFDPDTVSAGSEAEWLETLPAFQAKLLRSMLESQPPEEVAKAWLENTGQADTAQFGGSREVGSRLFQNLLIEMQMLLCTQEGYEQERQQLTEGIGTGKVVTTAAIATALAPHIGITAAVISPAVVLVLVIVSRAGQATICETITSLISANTDQSEGDDSASNEITD